MTKLICHKCGGEISNDFNQTLSFCTNCGTPIQSPFTDKTVSLDNQEKPLSAPSKPPNSPAPRRSNAGRYFLIALGLSAGAILLGTIGTLGYWYWSAKNFYHPDYFGRIVPPKAPVVRIIAFEAKTLDPHFGEEPIIIHALFDGLTEFNNQNTDLSPSLAESWESNADASVWTFRLRKNVKWTDGQPITANDFVYSWRRGLNPQLKSDFYQVNLLCAIKNGVLYATEKAKAEDVGVRAVDDYTLQVTMEKPTPFFDKMVAQTIFRPVPRAAVEKFGENWTKPENIVTSGAFKLSEWTPKDQITVERNPQFWDNAQTKLEKIVFISAGKKAFMSSETIDHVDYYEKGDIDISLFPFSDNKTYETKKDFVRIKSLAVNYLAINTTIKPFSDVRVRRALGLSVHRKKLKEKGLASFPIDSLTPEIKDYDNPQAGYNPAEARKLLAEAGYPNGTNFPELEITCTNLVGNKEVMEFFKEQWQQELGIKVKVTVQDLETFQKSLRDVSYRGLALTSWDGMYADPFTFLYLFARENRAGWNDSRYREMIEKSNLETDQNKRYRNLRDAELYLLEQQPAIPVNNQAGKFLCKPYVKNFALNPFDHINWREVYVDRSVTANTL